MYRLRIFIAAAGHPVAVRRHRPAKSGAHGGRPPKSTPERRGQGARHGATGLMVRCEICAVRKLTVLEGLGKVVLDIWRLDGFQLLEGIPLKATQMTMHCRGYYEQYCQVQSRAQSCGTSNHIFLWWWNERVDSISLRCRPITDQTIKQPSSRRWKTRKSGYFMNFQGCIALDATYFHCLDLYLLMAWNRDVSEV